MRVTKRLEHPGGTSDGVLADGSGASDESVARARARTKINDLIHEFFAHLPPLPANECPLAVPLYGASEVIGALGALLDQEVTMGPRVREFERVFAEFAGSRHAVMVNSGSSANLVALSALSSESFAGGLRPGDEVLVPAVTWPTTVAPVLQLGCVPVLVDIDERTLNIDLDLVEAAIGPRTRAIFPVHLLGNPVDMPTLMDLASAYGLHVIEDSCESLGSSVGGRRVGSFGEFGTFSFYFSHHITTIEGGMIVSDDDDLADLARSMRAHGWIRDVSKRDEIAAANSDIDPRFLFAHVGYNVRPTEVSAAFGLVQLTRLAEFNARRSANARYLMAALDGVSEHLAFVSEQEDAESSWFGFAFKLANGEMRQALSRHLEARRIETRPIVAGNLAAQPAFRDGPQRVAGPLHVATSISERGLFIGNHPSLTEAHLDHIAEAVGDFFRGEYGA